MAIVATEAEKRQQTRRNAPSEGAGRSGAAKRRRGPQGRVQKQDEQSLRSAPGTWARMDWLRQESSQKRQRSCGLRTHSDTVTAKLNGKRVTFGGVMACGSRRCPSCSDKLARGLRDDIEKAVQTWRDAGELVLFGTMTIRHNASQTLGELADAVSSCWEAATGGSGRAWLRDRKRFGIHGFVRIWEEKWTPENGWHVHVHFLLFVQRPAVTEGAFPTDALLASMFDRWRSKAGELGLGVPLWRAQDLHEIVAGEAADLALYFSKQSTSAGERTTSEAVGWEMSSPSTKTGGGLSPDDILVGAMAGDEYLKMIWHDYERGMKGRRTVAWSRGLRDALSIGKELTVAELEQREEAEGARVEVEMRSKYWRKLVTKPGRRSEFARRLVESGAAATVAWLGEWGIPASVGKREDQGGVVFIDAVETEGVFDDELVKQLDEMGYVSC